MLVLSVHLYPSVAQLNSFFCPPFFCPIPSSQLPEPQNSGAPRKGVSRRENVLIDCSAEKTAWTGIFSALQSFRILLPREDFLLPCIPCVPWDRPRDTRKTRKERRPHAKSRQKGRQENRRPQRPLRFSFSFVFFVPFVDSPRNTRNARKWRTGAIRVKSFFCPSFIRAPIFCKNVANFFDVRSS